MKWLSEYDSVEKDARFSPQSPPTSISSLENTRHNNPLKKIKADDRDRKKKEILQQRQLYQN